MPKQERIIYPNNENYWIELPEEWTGTHLVARAQIFQSTKVKTYLIKRLVASIVVLANFNLPGLDIDKSPMDWDYMKMPPPMWDWLINAVETAWNAQYNIEKKS